MIDNGGHSHVHVFLGGDLANTVDPAHQLLTRLTPHLPRLALRLGLAILEAIDACTGMSP